MKNIGAYSRSAYKKVNSKMAGQGIGFLPRETFQEVFFQGVAKSKCGYPDTSADELSTCGEDPCSPGSMSLS